jgi:hypothetical protein
MSSARGIEKRWCYISVDSSFVGYPPDSNDVSTESEEYPLLEAVARERLLKSLQTGEDLVCSEL